MAESMFSVMAFKSDPATAVARQFPAVYAQIQHLWTLAGLSTGTDAPMNICSDWWGRVEDLQA